MLDIKGMVADPENFVASLRKRHHPNPEVVHECIALHQQRNRLLGEMETKKAELNKKSKAMADVMKSGTDEQKTSFRAELKDLSQEVKAAGPAIQDLEERLHDLLLTLPNRLHSGVPEGVDDTENPEIRRWGEPPSFDFAVKQHFELPIAGLEFERGAKLSGARFVAYSGHMARLERALQNLMLDLASSAGYQEVKPPILVSRETMTGSGQLPKFEQDVYKTIDDMFLIPTSEVCLVNFRRDEILPEDELPVYYTTYSPCFRRESGSYGKDTRGIIRMHQFNKVELVKLTKPEDSAAELEKMVSDAERVLQTLELPYRVVELCGGDIGFAAHRTYDLEVWFPSQNSYREISSCSDTIDFQARRTMIRFRRKSDGQVSYVHALNGSGLGMDRTLAAVLENFQNQDGTISVPNALQPYMGGLTVIPALEP